MTDRTELRRLAEQATFGDGDEGGWARWTDLDGTPHMQGRVMVGFSAGVIPDGESWVEGAGGNNPVAECYTPELANFIAAANPAAVLGLLDALDLLDAELAHTREAAEEHDDVAGRLSHLLCDLTGGRMSKTSYPAQEIEQYLFECHESDLKDERDALVDRLAHMTEARDSARQRVAELEEAVEQVRDLHFGEYVEDEDRNRCFECGDDWPCPTIAAIGGEES